MDIAALSQSTAADPAAVQPKDAFSQLDSQDFFKLIIANLTNQDPLEPMDNQQLLEQIASLRQMENLSSFPASAQHHGPATSHDFENL